MNRDCPCGNDKCPRSPLYNTCEHCLCLPVPAVPIGTAITWGGQTGTQCCKCQFFQPTVSWPPYIRSFGSGRTG